MAKLDQKFPQPEPFKGRLPSGVKLCFSFLAKGSAGCSNARCALMHARDISEVFSPATNADRDTWKAAESYARLYFSESAQNRYYTQHRQEPACFSVRHFAGAVKYTASGWLDKNRDTLSSTVREVLAASTLPLLGALFEGEEREGAKEGAKPKLTLGGHFREQLVGLLEGLGRTEPHFVRCVKVSPSPSTPPSSIYLLVVPRVF